MMEDFILNNIKNKDNWYNLDDNSKIEYIKQITNELCDYVNDRSYNITQRIDYNSQVEHFRIVFEREIIAKSSIFVKKKKYAYLVKDDEGIRKHEIKVKGLEIVRSDSSEAIRTELKKILELILENNTDEEIVSEVNKSKKILYNVTPEEIAANIGVNGLSKYIVDGKCIKGTPWHVKAVNNYNTLLKILNIESTEEPIHDSTKIKVVYIKPNIYNLESIAFHIWPEKFNKNNILPDYDKMIQLFFIKKIQSLFDAIKKSNILNEGKSKQILNLFF